MSMQSDVVFVFKQKTAYELRISDWSSDVCSSDLQVPIPDRWRLIETLGVVKERWFDPYHQNTLKGDRPIDPSKVKWLPIKGDDWFFGLNLIRQEERRVGNGGVSTGRARW